MSSSDSQLSQSGEFNDLPNISYNQLDQNSINKGNLAHGFSSKPSSSINNKQITIDLLKRIQMLEHKLEMLQSKDVEFPRKKKKIRRKAREIPRTFTCQWANCGKEYGSQASLKNHRKIKHGIHLIRKSRISGGKSKNTKRTNQDL